jgi:hypothetical protein
LQILYHILNRDERSWRIAVMSRMSIWSRELRDQRVPLFSLESRRPLAAYDVIGITLPYELCYTNILTVLDLAGLPLPCRGAHGEAPSGDRRRFLLA